MRDFSYSRVSLTDEDVEYLVRVIKADMEGCEDVLRIGRDVGAFQDYHRGKDLLRKFEPYRKKEVTE